jgi:hypothetical protein
MEGSVVMNNREEILRCITDARVSLAEAFALLREENENGKQYDYVNAPVLSDSFDVLERTVNKMGKIIYQKR